MSFSGLAEIRTENAKKTLCQLFNCYSDINIIVA